MNLKKIEKVLIIQTAFLGDVILSTAFVKAFHELAPHTQMDILLIPQTAEVYKDNPHINKILLFDKRRTIGRLFSFFQVLRQIRKTRYELAISLQVYMSSSLLMVCGGIPNRLGFPRQKLLTMTISLPKGLPVVKRNLLLLTPFTDKEFEPQTEIFWNDTIDCKVKKLLERETPAGKVLIGIAPGSVWATKRWLADYYSALIQTFEEKGWFPVLIGGKEDKTLCKRIVYMAGIPALNLAGRLSIRASAAVIRRLAALVTNDSAPLHLANAVQTDVIAIFGPTVRGFGFAPYRDNDSLIEVNLPCRPCGKHGGRYCPMKHFRCMRDIKPEKVLKAIESTLERQCQKN